MSMSGTDKRLSNALNQIISEDALIQNQCVETLIKLGAASIQELQS